MRETYEIAPDGTPERLIQRLENANCGELFYCEADREEAVEIAQEEFTTALAKAEAQARQDAFEEAAGHLALMASRTAQWGGHLAAGVITDCVSAIRALATAPAETEKPETGESKTHWALRLAMQYLDRCAAEDQGFHEDGPKPEADACSVCTELAAVLGIDIESPEYDALVAYPPQPTATNTLEDGHA